METRKSIRTGTHSKQNGFLETSLCHKEALLGKDNVKEDWLSQSIRLRSQRSGLDSALSGFPKIFQTKEKTACSNPVNKWGK